MKALRAVYLLIILLSISSILHAQETYKVKVQNNVAVKMRDNVTLKADIYRPDVAGKFPVIITRTPYNRRDSGTGNFLASHGYVVITQDVRGRYDSEGEFYPFKNEMNDGYDTFEWASKLDYSDGQIGMYGGSYVGATQMLGAMSGHPALKSIFPYITASEYYDGWTYQNGALMQAFTSTWTSGLAEDTLRRKATALYKPKEWLNTLPVEQYKIISYPTVEDVAPYFKDWMIHEQNDEYWKQWKVSDHYNKMTVKALHSGGWHDIFLKGSIKNYEQMRKSAATSDSRDNQRLLIGPWAHTSTSSEGKIADVVFGKQAVLNTHQMMLTWFDYSLKGIKNEFATNKPVRIFIMGENQWRDEDEFPLARTQYTKYYFHTAKGANSVNGDGTLSTTMPAGEKPDTYEYDPFNPVPTIGGRLCCGGTTPGPYNQSPNESRNDVLVFSTPPLVQDVETTGYFSVDLYASSTTVDTDFTAMIVDVDTNGYATLLTDGIVRARYRNSTEKAEPIEPGKIYKYTIDLWATSNLFKKGHRIRVYISSSNFPRFNRNLNTGEPIVGATRMQKAQQTIYHDLEHPSAITLPVIPRQ